MAAQPTCRGCKKQKLPMIKIELFSGDENDGINIWYCPLCIINALDIVKEACIEGMHLKRYV